MVQGEWAGETIGPDVWELCRELIPAGSVFAFLAEHRAVLFPAEMFADMYPSADGRSSMPPQVLAAAVVLQSLHGLSDFETVQELRCDLRWKAACGLGLHDTAFDPSLLSYFRRRLARSARPHRIFDAVRKVVRATGVLKGKQRRALDSTVLDDAVATQDTITQLVSAIRAVIRAVPGASDVAARQCTAHDYSSPGKPRIAWNDEEARAALADALVGDALRLLGHLPNQDLGEKAANAVGLLALVAGQDVEPADGSDGQDGRWRISRGTASERVVSTVDPDSRHVHKTRSHYQDGFKAHLAMEPETGLVTAVELTPGAGPAHHEAVIGLGLLADEDGPLDVLGDTAYCTTEARAALTAAGHRLFLKPAPLRPVVPGGFTVDDFAIDTTGNTVVCPRGRTAELRPPSGMRHQRKAVFTAEQCVGCELRNRCTKARADRIVTIRPHHDLMADARRNNTWLHHRAAALNLRRLINLGLTRTNHTWHLGIATG